MSPYADSNNPPRFMAGHMALIPTGSYRGQVLVWNFMRPFQATYGAGNNVQYWSIMDPAASPPQFLNYALSVPAVTGYESQDLFCSGHSWTLHGQLFVAGGDRWYRKTAMSPLVGHSNDLAYTFDPKFLSAGNGMWRQEPNLAIRRWYPTVTTMATDSVASTPSKDLILVSGGLDQNSHQAPQPALHTYETFWPKSAALAGSWETNPTPSFPTIPRLFLGPAVANTLWWMDIYPRTIVLSSGKIFYAGMGEQSYRVLYDNVTTTNPPTWEIMTQATGTDKRLYGSVVLSPNLGGSNGGLQDLVLRIGGINLTSTTATATSTVEYCYAGLDASDGQWQAAQPMSYARAYPNSVILPDSTILVVGGKTDVGNQFATGNPILQTELFNETPFAWRTLAPMQTRRAYHSTAILLPSGKVLVGGGEQREYDYEIFQPPYMTNGTVRPVIMNAPSTLNLSYGQTSGIQYQALNPGVYIEKVVLMAPASLTHHSDMHARYVELDIDNDAQPPFPPPPNPMVFFKAAVSSKYAPKGNCMLFLVTNVQGVPGAPKGTPSVATWVELK